MRYGLAAVFVMIAVASVPLATFRRELHRRAESRAALNAIDRLIVVRDPNLPQHPVYSRFENHAPEQVSSAAAIDSSFSDEDVPLLLGFENLEHLMLLNTQVTEAGLMELTKLPGLKRISVSGPAITEDSLTRFRRMRPDVRAYLGQQEPGAWTQVAEVASRATTSLE